MSNENRVGYPIQTTREGNKITKVCVEDYYKMINRIIAEQDGKRIIELFKDLVLRSYGKKSDDGRRFIKSQELREDFAQTEAYSDLFMELATDADAAAKFVNGIVPNIPETKPAPAK